MTDQTTSAEQALEDFACAFPGNYTQTDGEAPHAEALAAHLTASTVDLARRLGADRIMFGVSGREMTIAIVVGDRQSSQRVDRDELLSSRGGPQRAIVAAISRLAWFKQLADLAVGHQPAPLGERAHLPSIWDLVIADMRGRDATGRAKYGTPLQANNGRDALLDAYQEALDLAVYLRQEIEERNMAHASMVSEGMTLRQAWLANIFLLRRPYFGRDIYAICASKDFEPLLSSVRGRHQFPLADLTANDWIPQPAADVLERDRKYLRPENGALP